MPLLKSQGKKLRDAASLGDLRTVRRLCESEACDVNKAANGCGDTPLHKACRRGHLEMVRYFVLERRANVRVRDEDGDLPIHSACIMGHVDVVRFLVQHKNNDGSSSSGDAPNAIIQATNNEGWTPLHKACYWGRLSVVQYLLEQAPSQWQMQNKHGKNALDLAKARKQNAAVVQFLEQFINKGSTLIEQEEEEISVVPQVKIPSKKQPDQEVAKRTDVEELQKVIYQAHAPTPISIQYVKFLQQNAEIVGKGAFGSVFKVQDKERKWDFALKQIMYPIQSLEQQEFIENSFRTELAALSMACHPNIIRLFGFYVDTVATQHVLLFEYAERGSLDGILSNDEKRKLLTSTVRLHILFQVVRALHYLHQGGPKGSTPFLHRDVKSANVCLTKDYTAKLIDCGLGKLVDDDNHSLKSAMSSGSLVFGTNGYTCPWYSKGGSRRYEPSCDVYSFGIVMMECITGCLQGGQSSQGGKTNLGDFRSRYIEDDEEEEIQEGLSLLLNDSDPDAGWEDDEILGQLCELALGCASQKKKIRPNTQACIDSLSRLIHQEEFGLESGRKVVSTAVPLARTPCLLCRRNPFAIACQNQHGICGPCLDIQVERNLHAPSIVCPVDGCFCQPYTLDQLAYAVSLELFKVYQKYRFGMLDLFSILPDAVDRQSTFQSDVRAFMARQSATQDQLLEKHSEFQAKVFETLSAGSKKEAEQLARMSASISQNAQEQAEFHLLLLQEIRSVKQRDPSMTNSMLQRILKGLTHYIAGTQELCPRWVVVEIPDNKPGRQRRPKEWFRGLVKTKVNLYLVCQHSHRRMADPIELEVNRQWMVQIMPALSYTLLALKLACETGASTTIASFLPSNVLDEQYSFYREILSKTLDEAALDAFDDLSKQLEPGETTRRALSASLSAGRSQVTKLTEQSYRILSEKLAKEKRSWWREKMVAVMDSDGHVIYVLKEYAHHYTNIQHGGELVDVKEAIALDPNLPTKTVHSGKTSVTAIDSASLDDEGLWC